MELSPSPSIALDSQVGGHGGILSSSDGAVIIKPCLPLEAAFYKTLSSNEMYSQLASIVPRFYGTLTLHGRLDESGNIISEPEGGGDTPLLDVSETEKDEPLMFFVIFLENLTHTFAKPNVIDMKLGTVLWSDDATPDKRLRMERSAQETTSLETGIRLTGFNVFDYTEGKVINATRAYGKSLKKQDLPTGIAKCFPLAISTSDVPQGQGLPKELLKQVLEGIIIEIKEIIDILKRVDVCMVGTSLLIIYEADWDILKRTLLDWPSKKIEVSTTFDVEDEEKEEEEAQYLLNEHDIAEDEDDESEGNEDTRSPYIVKLIDFAHTSLKKRKDTGVILGLETTLELLTGRLKEISDTSPI
ncbi:hypothetical protein Clacol_006107 [Clathrus columnatus]|uniref:Kinase n=1 Tax=Clathrus columnatus TaxID=1419009 RepID=A0AAV5AFB0_9AGAM|nr:hypothetical protein Clacol_006107 [Clathrus columnatus]